MDSQLREQILAEVRRIGDELLSKAEHDQNGMSWKSMNLSQDRVIDWVKGPTIYSGVSGIALFFLELYRQTQNQEYLDAAVQGMRWSEWFCRENPTDYYALFTGRMGVPLALLRMYHFTNESVYLEKALAIARSGRDFLKASGQVDDLIGGTAGALLGFLHLHAASREDWLLEAIDRFIEHLLAAAHAGKSGLYWDRSPMHISGLCGFSHGAAGIGFVFLELARYFRNEAFYWLAEQAFGYETNYFDREKKNWLDLRKGIYNDEDYRKHEKAYMEGDLDFFTTGGDMNAWCHGAAGLGLSRLRAFELLDNPQYADEARTAIEKTRTTDIELENPRPGFILCHGGGGNADLFLEAYRTFKEESYLSLAETVARQALAYIEKKGVYISGFADAGKEEDTSLFMGNAGIGYFYLRVLSPSTVPSILLPRLEAEPVEPMEPVEPKVGSGYPHIGISIGEIEKRVLKRYFQRTIGIGEKLLGGGLDDYFSARSRQNQQGFKESFIDFAAGAIPQLPPEKRELMAEIFDLERQKLRMDEAVSSHSLLSIQDQVRAKEAGKWGNGDESILALRLALAPEVEIGTSCWNWDLKSDHPWLRNTEAEPDEFYLLLKPAAMGVMEEPLSPFSYVVLTAFEEAQLVKEAIPEVIDAFESLSPEEEKILKDKIIEQVRVALSAGILLPA